MKSENLAELLEEWFAREQRPLPWRERYDPYEVWIAEIMAQQTRIEVVTRYWTAFLDRFPTVRALAMAPEDDVLRAWSGLGYYRRARMLHEGARQVVALWDGRVPDDPEVLRSIRGVGRYTAGAIASIAYDRPVPIVDGNVQRVFARLVAAETPLGSPALEKGAWAFAGDVVTRARSPRILNQAIMELGATVCTPKAPSCARCPLAPHCRAYERGSQHDHPRGRARSAPVDLDVPVYLIRDERGRVLLMRRAGGGRLGRLFRLPGEDPSFGAAVHVTEIDRGRSLGVVRHTITNRRIRFEIFEGDLTGDPAGGDLELRWIDPGALDEVPHPSWVRKAMRLGGPGE